MWSALSLLVASTFRLPVFASFLTGIAVSIVSWLAQWFTRRTAVSLGVVAAVVALTIAIFASIKALIASISFFVPSYVSQGCDMILPDNFLPCVSILLSAHAIRWVWAWKVHFIGMYVSGN